jgi:hypothetical protein
MLLAVMPVPPQKEVAVLLGNTEQLTVVAGLGDPEPA